MMAFVRPTDTRHVGLSLFRRCPDRPKDLFFWFVHSWSLMSGRGSLQECFKDQRESSYAMFCARVPSLDSLHSNHLQRLNESWELQASPSLFSWIECNHQPYGDARVFISTVKVDMMVMKKKRQQSPAGRNGASLEGSDIGT